jgi:hypothetical protein
MAGAVWGAAGLVSVMAMGAAAVGGAPWGCFIKRMPITPANPASRIRMTILGLIFSRIVQRKQKTDPKQLHAILDRSACCQKCY